MSLADQVCEINTLTGEIVFNGNITVLRPKTFQLFLLLASAPETIFSKAEILASVWEGTVVEDQVIFQSINEIRKELGNADVIKTYPRRGYCIGVSIIITDSSNHAKKDNSTLQHFQYSKKLIVSVVLFFLVLTGMVLTYFASNTSSPPAEVLSSNNNQSIASNTLSHKGILVLPFDVSALTDSQQWLRYGAMEGVIKKINPNSRTTIFHLEDAIEILNRIPIGKRNNINNIFARSGASYILETSVSGTPGELIFIFTSYSRTTRITKTINVKNLEDGLIAIVNSLEKTLEENLTYNEGEFDRQLQNDLISKAVQFLEVEDYASALTFINSSLINDPNNMTALYFLVKIKLMLSEIEDVIEVSNRALDLIEKGSEGEHKARLLYFKGIALLSLGKLELAEQNILAASKLARDEKDWLYHAYTQSMLGKLNQKQQHYDKAYEFFNSALVYQELLNCPLGITQGYIDFAYYYLSKGEIEQAKQSTAKAKALIQEKKLTKAMHILMELEEGVSSF